MSSASPPTPTESPLLTATGTSHFIPTTLHSPYGQVTPKKQLLSKVQRPFFISKDRDNFSPMNRSIPLRLPDYDKKKTNHANSFHDAQRFFEKKKIGSTQPYYHLQVTPTFSRNDRSYSRQRNVKLKTNEIDQNFEYILKYAIRTKKGYLPNNPNKMN